MSSVHAAVDEAKLNFKVTDRLAMVDDLRALDAGLKLGLFTSSIDSLAERLTFLNSVGFKLKQIEYFRNAGSPVVCSAKLTFIGEPKLGHQQGELTELTIASVSDRRHILNQRCQSR